MNPDLDYNDPHQSNEEFDRFLDELHSLAEAERIEQMIEEIEQREGANDLPQRDYTDLARKCAETSIAEEEAPF